MRFKYWEEILTATIVTFEDDEAFIPQADGTFTVVDAEGEGIVQSVLWFVRRIFSFITADNDAPPPLIRSGAQADLPIYDEAEIAGGVE